MSADQPGFWRDPQRSVLGLFYMAGSVVAFAAGILDGTAELIAFIGWVLATIGFYWAVHSVLRGGLFGEGPASNH